METQRLVLREMTDDDLEDFYEIFSSAEVSRFINKMSHEDVERYFEKRKQKPKNPYSYAVALKENNKMIGTCGVKLDGAGVGRLSYVFNPRYWNKGYCTEACRAVLKYCFESTRINRIEADCFENNYPSIHILRDKLKMRQVEGKKKEEFNEFTQKMTNFSFFAINRQEYFDNL